MTSANGLTRQASIQDEYELEPVAAFPSQDKGKSPGSSVDAVDRLGELGNLPDHKRDHDLDHDDSDDAEVERLLQHDSSATPQPSSAEESGEGTETRSNRAGLGHARKHSATDLRKSRRIPKGGGGFWVGMSPSQRGTFFREMLLETLPVFFLVLVGAILTGELLGRLQEWRVFIRIEELFILVPILLNLKGNLEMNLAARFSTSANIGELDLRLTRRSLVLGNLALLQVQALIVSLLSGLLAFLLGLASRNGVHHALQHPIHKGEGGISDDLRGGYFEALLVLCVSMLAAAISSGVLGSFTCALVVLCRRFRVNPDNVSTPLASMLGDVVTLVILGGLASLFAKFMGTIVSTLVFVFLLVAVVVNLVFTFRNAYVQELLSVGWGPLFLAMAISSGSGVVLETYVNAYQGFGLLSPMLTALSGATSSVFVARISTALHSAKREPYLLTTACLWTLGTSVCVVAWAFAWTTDQVPRGLAFGIGYLVVAAVQTLLGLVVAQHGSLLLWKWDYDPDVYALPLLTSFLDVSGQLLLVGAYVLDSHFSSSSSGSPTSDLGGAIAGNLTNTIGDVVARGAVALVQS
ncbi:hypothetical protein JCM10212_006547 [Sporobolomyces blumeae]